MPDTGVTPQRAASIESRASWTAACLTLAILSISYGAPLLVVVGLKPIQEALGTDRSVVALAGALVWVGTGLGGIMMGWLADRIGIRITATIGAVMMAAGLALSVHRQRVGAVCRARSADRPGRQRRDLCAAGGLCHAAGSIAAAARRWH